VNTQILEEIGMTKGEISVYLSMLELGSSTVGPIVKKAKVSSSKIYNILDRLIEKGLASYVIKENAKYFESAPPFRILDYLKEKASRLEEQEEEITKMLPELELKQKLVELKSDAHVYKGNKGWHTAFYDIIKTLEPGEELLVSGIFDFSDSDVEFFDMIMRFHKKRDNAGIKCRVLLNYGVKKTGEALDELKLTKVKYMPYGVFTPTVFLIYRDKVIISLPRQRTFVTLESKEAYLAFKNRFDNMWDQETQVLRGMKAVEEMWEEALLYPELKLIGAKGYFVDRDPKFFLKIMEKAKKKNRKWKNVVDQESRGHLITQQSVIETKYISEDFSNPTAIWIYGNVVTILNWSEEEPIIFRIENTKVVESYEQYFEHLWK